MPRDIRDATLSITLLTTLAFATAAEAGVRDVQIKSVNTATGVVTIFNFGPDDQPLTSYRICTADDNEFFKYTTGGLAGMTIEAGTEFRFHWNNDAPGTDPGNEINVNTLGGQIAGPLDNGPYGLAIYWATPFSTATNMADYVQWTDNLGNPGNVSADARAGTAINGGLWTAINDWVVTAADTVTIDFIGDPDGDPHTSAAYEVAGPTACDGDLDNSGDIGFGDLLQVIAAWGDCTGCAEDVDENGNVGFSDILTLIAYWGACP